MSWLLAVVLHFFPQDDDLPWKFKPDPDGLPALEQFDDRDPAFPTVGGDDPHALPDLAT
jgi:hypothetical protein